MEDLYIYLITTGVALTLLLLYRFIYWPLLIPHPLKCFFLQYLMLPLLLNSSKWVRVTRFEALIVLLHLSLNIIFLALASANSLPELASTMALINLLPAFLGQWTNPLAQFLGISQTVYLLIHRWTGRIAVIHICIHTFFILKQYQNFSTDRLISGCATASTLLVILATTLYCFRSYMSRILPGLHLCLGLLSLGTLLWHVIPGSNMRDRILSISAVALWGLGAAYRAVRVAFLSTRAVVKSTQRTDDVVQLKLRTVQPVSIAPGSYFHVFLPVSRSSKDHWQFIKYNFLQSYLLAAYWHPTEQNISGPSDPTEQNITEPSNLILLIDSSKLPRFHQIKKNQTLLLDGPYQQGLDLENYDVLVLTAEGKGILKVLPIMRNLMARRVFDKTSSDMKSLFRDRTRRVDLFWWLGHDVQDKWVQEQLESLQSLDPENKFLIVWLLYPGPQSTTSTPPFKTNTHWVCVHDCAGSNKEETVKRFHEAVTLEALAPGRRTVVTCGSAEFIDTQRAFIIEKNSDHLDINFIVLEEMKPLGSPSNARDIEMQATQGIPATTGSSGSRKRDVIPRTPWRLWRRS